MTEEEALLAAIVRSDFAGFVERCFLHLEPGTVYAHNWHVEAVAYELMRVFRGEERRLIINLPPRYMKSIMVTIGFTAWVLGQDPTKKVITVSYASDLSRKLDTDFQHVVTSPWFRAAFPHFNISSNRTGNLRTTARGYRYSTSIGGAVTGWGADLIVIDDPIKGLDAALSPSERATRGRVL